MSLVGQTVRIIVSEPFEWNYGNLFGQITSDRGGDKLMVKLTQEIKCNKLKGDIVELKPRHANERVVLLEKYYSLTVNGTLVTPQGREFVFAGSVTVD